LEGAANKAVLSSSSSNKLLLDGLGLGLLAFPMAEDLDAELMDVTDWLDLTLADLGFSSSDHSLSSYREAEE
jgi:hypothetical protein